MPDIIANEVLTEADEWGGQRAAMASEENAPAPGSSPKRGGL